MRAVGIFLTSTLAVLALSCSVATAHGGTGLAPGVHADPGSPAAKEYAIPLAQASQVGDQSSSSGSSSVAAFGAGIKPPGSGGSPGSGSGSGHTKAHRGGASSGSGSPNAPSPQTTLPAAVVQASSGGGGSILALRGGGAAILALGGFGGAVLWRPRRSTPSPSSAATRSDS